MSSNIVKKRRLSRQKLQAEIEALNIPDSISKKLFLEEVSTASYSALAYADSLIVELRQHFSPKILPYEVFLNVAKLYGVDHLNVEDQAFFQKNPQGNSDKNLTVIFIMATLRASGNKTPLAKLKPQAGRIYAQAWHSKVCEDPASHEEDEADLAA